MNIPALSEKTWKIIIGCLLGLLVFSFVLFGISRCSDWNFNRKLAGANANLANALNQLANVQDQQAVKEKELANIKIEEAVQKQVVKDAAKDAEIAANAEREAQIAANQAVSNVNAVSAADFTNTTLSNALKARCKAFPEIPECQ